MKRILVFLFASLLAILPVNAESTEKNELSNDDALIFSINEEYQEYRFVDDAGLMTTISVTSSRNGEHTISMENDRLRMSFKIYVSNNQIISAYGENYYTNVYNVIASNLSVDSSVQATYTITIKKLLISTDKYLRANISTGSIVVTHN